MNGKTGKICTEKRVRDMFRASTGEHSMLWVSSDSGSVQSDTQRHRRARYTNLVRWALNWTDPFRSCWKWCKCNCHYHVVDRLDWWPERSSQSSRRWRCVPRSSVEGRLWAIWRRPERRRRRGCKRHAPPCRQLGSSQTETLLVVVGRCVLRQHPNCRRSSPDKEMHGLLSKER